MISQKRSLRHGFTIRELIAVLVVLGLILMIAIPSCLREGRGGNRSGACRYNLRNLALAVVSYESVHNHYPGFHDAISHADGRPLSRPLLYMILPQLERSDLFEVGDATNHPRHDLPDLVAQQRLQLLVCPSVIQADTSAAQGPVSCYVANTGMPDVAQFGAPLDQPANGVFQNRYWAVALGDALPDNDARYVERHDGTTNTLLMSERREVSRWTDTEEYDAGFVWSPDFADNPLAQINSQPANGYSATKYVLARPSSHHPRRVNAAFCDGHVQSMRDNIDYRVYAQLMTPRGSAATYPDSRNGKPQLVDESFRRPIMDEDWN
jgi:prepilin-type processing-associated H-X9-DG protein/prepilin-type N-terminal cleavage/methylation domain-containing protein